MDKELLYQIALTLVPGLGPVLARKLVSTCGSAGEVFSESSSRLIKLPGIGANVVSSIKNRELLERAGRELEFIGNNGVRALFFLDDNYPKRLRQCHDAPLLLYIKGELDCLEYPKMVAVVGSRRMTEYGRDNCERLVGEFTEFSAVIVSGLAYGVDACAHRFASSAGLPMVAVLGHGLDRIYPRVHSGLAGSIMENGLLVTEFISGTTPARENFPRRNRIIAGLADAVVVIEAALSGGALITADLANSYNRDVFALPGRVNDRYSQGCNKLIRINKAHLIESARDMQYIMNWKQGEKLGRQTGLFVVLTREERVITDYLHSNGESGIDEIVAGTGFNLGLCTSILLGLEFKGVVRAMPGRCFRLLSR